MKWGENADLHRASIEALVSANLHLADTRM